MFSTHLAWEKFRLWYAHILTLLSRKNSTCGLLFYNESLNNHREIEEPVLNDHLAKRKLTFLERSKLSMHRAKSLLKLTKMFGTLPSTSICTLILATTRTPQILRMEETTDLFLLLNRHPNHLLCLLNCHPPTRKQPFLLNWDFSRSELLKFNLR